ncbi:unnamed protein product (macronuclear) [Paramecium tetraurelia]|uniref:Transmembrane protein n=1 Tax=Paramecium tetraurelia TaxID=5888 RepID=A0DFN3_PARTE|nr:uncharacterized protein GSPATT00016663001 [Paramecium tetraurelia]CAK81850.1 unnamed protein product [Paramecium tetraurelia]|eukprot:XP_001449247.1 hypothetical protein (macronuclear) [Paramecium tetraurelia strain d4-2]
MNNKNVPTGLHYVYSPQVQMRSLASLKIIAPLCIVLALCSVVIGFIWYAFNGLTEFLIIGINNIAVLFTCIFSLYWSLTSKAIGNEVMDSPDGYHNNTIPYLHSLFTQLVCAIESGLVLSLIEYDSYNQFLLVLPIQILEIFLLLYMANVSRQFNIREYGIQRLVVYGTSVVNLLFLIFASFSLKQVMLQINSQLYQISTTNVEITLVKLVLFVLFITTLIVAMFNLKRIKIYFVTLAFLILSICILACCINGLLVRRVQELEVELSTNQGCKFAMQSISEKSLNDQLECSEKYFDLELSPYLPCEQDVQSYQWEGNAKNNKLGCINLKCCNSVKEYVFNPINSLTIWLNLIIMVGIVQSFNTAMLSEGSYKKFRMHVVGDAMVFIILVLLAILVVVAYNITPELSVNVQHSLVKQEAMLNEITVLPTPIYKNFDKQEKLVGFYNLQSCEPISSVMIQKIAFKSTENLKGITLAISGTNGQFVALKEFNNEKLKIIIDDEITKAIFSSLTQPFDAIIIQGDLEEAEKFFNNNLHYCSDNPLSADFDFIIEYYEIPQQHNRMLQALSKEQQQVGDQAFQFYNVQITIENSADFTPIADTLVEVYEGKFLSQSCQIIRQLENNLHELKTDEQGNVVVNNLSQGYSYTVLVYKSGFKKSCSVLDLQRRVPKTKYVFRLTKSIPKHSVRILLEWTSKNLNLDLYGVFKVGEHPCLTGALSKSCGGMQLTTFSKNDQHIEVLDIYQLEPQVYTIFVKRFLTRNEALDLLTNSVVSQQWIDADPHITVYLSELNYPLIEFRLPQNINLQMDKLDLTWMVFKIDGQQSDAPQTLQKMESLITNDEIRTNTASNKPFWPEI